MSNWSSSKRGNSSSKFVKNRKRIHVRDMGICFRCEVLENKMVQGQEVDHFFPAFDERHSDEVDCLWLLCKECHGDKTRREQKHKLGFTPRINPATGWPFEEPDWLALIQERNETRRF